MGNVEFLRCGYRFFYTIDDERKIVCMIAADTRQRAY